MIFKTHLLSTNTIEFKLWRYYFRNYFQAGPRTCSNRKFLCYPQLSANGWYFTTMVYDFEPLSSALPDATFSDYRDILESDTLPHLNSTVIFLCLIAIDIIVFLQLLSY